MTPNMIATMYPAPKPRSSWFSREGVVVVDMFYIVHLFYVHLGAQARGSPPFHCHHCLARHQRLYLGIELLHRGVQDNVVSLQRLCGGDRGGER